MKHGWFHFLRHKWVALRVDHGEFVWGGGDGTRIYARCQECGATTQWVRNGFWTLEDLS